MVEYVVPRSVEAAVGALEGDALPVAGGVALGLLSNLDLVSVERLVSLARIPEMRGVAVAEGAVVLGAATPHAVLAADPTLRTELPELAAMFGRIGNIRVRAWGTVGGNLALAEPAQDPPVLLAALGAHVHTRGPAGERRIPVSALSEGPLTTVLGPAELITRVAVSRLAVDERCAYVKFLPRTADDYATVSAGVRLRLDGATIVEARIFCGAVGPVPVDCAAAAEALLGRSAEQVDVLDGLAEAVQDVVSPADDHRGSADYKRKMAGVFARRAVVRALAARPLDGRASHAEGGTG